MRLITLPKITALFLSLALALSPAPGADRPRGPAPAAIALRPLNEPESAPASRNQLTGALHPSAGQEEEKGQLLLMGAPEFSRFDAIAHRIVRTIGFDLRLDREALDLLLHRPSEEVIWFQTSLVRITRLPIQIKPFPDEYLVAHLASGAWDRERVSSWFGISSAGQSAEAWIKVKSSLPAGRAGNVFGIGWYRAAIRRDGSLVLTAKSQDLPLVPEQPPTDIAVIAALLYKVPSAAGQEEKFQTPGAALRHLLMPANPLTRFWDGMQDLAQSGRLLNGGGAPLAQHSESVPFQIAASALDRFFNTLPDGLPHTFETLRNQLPAAPVNLAEMSSEQFLRWLLGHELPPRITLNETVSLLSILGEPEGYGRLETVSKANRQFSRPVLQEASALDRFFKTLPDGLPHTFGTLRNGLPAVPNGFSQMSHGEFLHWLLHQERLPGVTLNETISLLSILGEKAGYGRFESFSKDEVGFTRAVLFGASTLDHLGEKRPSYLGRRTAYNYAHGWSTELRNIADRYRSGLPTGTAPTQLGLADYFLAEALADRLPKSPGGQPPKSGEKNKGLLPSTFLSYLPTLGYELFRPWLAEWWVEDFESRVMALLNNAGLLPSSTKGRILLALDGACEKFRRMSVPSGLVQMELTHGILSELVSGNPAFRERAAELGEYIDQLQRTEPPAGMEEELINDSLQKELLKQNRNFKPAEGEVLYVDITGPESFQVIRGTVPDSDSVFPTMPVSNPVPKTSGSQPSLSVEVNEQVRLLFQREIKKTDEDGISRYLLLFGPDQRHVTLALPVDEMLVGPDRVSVDPHLLITTVQSVTEKMGLRFIGDFQTRPSFGEPATPVPGVLGMTLQEAAQKNPGIVRWVSGGGKFDSQDAAAPSLKDLSWMNQVEPKLNKEIPEPQRVPEFGRFYGAMVNDRPLIRAFHIQSDSVPLGKIRYVVHKPVPLFEDMLSPWNRAIKTRTVVYYFTDDLIAAGVLQERPVFLEDRTADRAASLRRLEADLRADLRKPVSRRSVRPMYIREMAYRRQRPNEDHPHHVGVMVSFSPTTKPIGFLPIRNVIIDKEWEVNVSVKIHYLSEMLAHQEPLLLIVQRAGFSYKPGSHLDFVFMAARPLTGRDLEGRQHILDERSSGSEPTSTGLEEPLTADTVRAVGRDVRNSFAEPLAAVEALLQRLKVAETSRQEDQVLEAMQGILHQSGEMREMLHALTSPDGSVPLPLRLILQHELGNGIQLLLGIPGLYDRSVDWGELPHQRAAMQRGVARMREVIAEVESLPHLRLGVMGANGTYVVLSCSGASLLPQWKSLEDSFRLYGSGLKDEVERLRAAAGEAGADQAMLIPVTPAEAETITLYPSTAPDAADLPVVQDYVGDANRVLTSLGIQFASPQLAEDGKLQRLGFVVYENHLPEGLVPEGYTVVAAAQLQPGRPGTLHPALLAAKVLHPKLSWEFLLKYQVKAVLLLQDPLTGARYLAILA